MYISFTAIALKTAETPAIKISPVCDTSFCFLSCHENSYRPHSFCSQICAEKCSNCAVRTEYLDNSECRHSKSGVFRNWLAVNLVAYDVRATVLRWRGVFRREKRRPGLDADNVTVSSAEVENGWSYTSTPPTCLHDVQRDNFCLLFYIRKDFELNTNNAHNSEVYTCSGALEVTPD